MQNGIGEKQSELKYQVFKHRPNSIKRMVSEFECVNFKITGLWVCREKETLEPSRRWP